MFFTEFSKAMVHLKSMGDSGGSSTSNIRKINFQPTKDGRAKSNRYALQFFKESNEEIAKRKEFARHSLEMKTEKDLEVTADDFFDSKLNFPKRPPWNFDLNKDELDARENRYFIVSTRNLK